jgi:hypothetical protein
MVRCSACTSRRVAFGQNEEFDYFWEKYHSVRRAATVLFMLHDL